MKKPKKSPRVTRRRLLQSGAAFTLTASLAEPAAADHLAAQAVKRSVYEALGLKHIINATGTVTNLGGSLMPPEVIAAWSEAARHFVNLVQLQDRVGERIAKLLGVEAALVTTGAAGAILLGTAAIVAGSDRKKIARLPDTTGMKSEVLLQRAHSSATMEIARKYALRASRIACRTSSEAHDSTS